MNNTYIAIGIIAAVLLGGIVYKSSMNGDKMMAEKQEPVIVAEGASKDGMMKDSISTSSMRAGMEEDGSMMGVGVVLSSGKIMLEDGGKMSPIVGDYMFKSGLRVMANGKVMRTDGISFMLKEGQSVWQDGSVMDEKMMDNPAGNGETMMKEDSMKADAMMAKAGSYIPYDSAKLAMAKTGHVVLFFRAAWCPTCRNVDNDIKSHLEDIPSNLTILDVNYDEAKELRVKYGVTYQHTFVQVDANGMMIKKWSGSPTLAALVSEVK
jgi:thiol-disulfide isomerase/thioredoxin